MKTGNAGFPHFHVVMSGHLYFEAIMRLLEKTKLKKLLFTLVMLVALPMCLAFIMPGAGTTAEALDDDVIYRDTDVKNILVKFMTGT